MSIWSSEIKELEKLYESFKGQMADLYFNNSIFNGVQCQANPALNI